LYRIEQVQWLLKDLFSLLSSPDRVDQGGALAVVSMMVFFGAREGDLLAKTPGEDPPLAKKILRRKESGRPAVQY
jgi:hypothetical protein